MSMLTERLQVLIAPEQRERLEAEARRRGAPIGKLVRDAIDLAYPATTAERQAALDDILSADPMDLPDVPDFLRELDDQRARRG
jgi:hypothetical protein